MFEARAQATDRLQTPEEAARYAQAAQQPAVFVDPEKLAFLPAALVFTCVDDLCPVAS